MESWRSPAANEPGITLDQLETQNGEPVGSNCRHYYKKNGGLAQIGLPQQVAAKVRWPTPRVGGEEGLDTLIKRKGMTAAVKHNLTAAVEHAQWPTPRAQEAKHGEPTEWEMQTEHQGTKHSLRVQVAKRDQNWPTPTVQDSNKATKKWRENHQNNLTAAAFNPHKIYPTPTARDFKGGYKTESLTRKDGKSRAHDALPNAVIDGKGVETVTGHLNPDWVEWIMGWPVGWTSMDAITELDWRDWSVDPADELQTETWSTPVSRDSKGHTITPNHPTGFNENLPSQVMLTERSNTGQIPRVTSERKHRVGRLKAIGNGQCPQAAALAWKILSQND